MHCLNAFRIRMLIVLMAMFIFWQIFRNWPGADDYAVSCKSIEHSIQNRNLINILN